MQIFQLATLLALGAALANAAPVADLNPYSPSSDATIEDIQPQDFTAKTASWERSAQAWGGPSQADWKPKEKRTPQAWGGPSQADWKPKEKRTPQAWGGPSQADWKPKEKRTPQDTSDDSPDDTYQDPYADEQEVCPPPPPPHWGLGKGWAKKRQEDPSCADQLGPLYMGSKRSVKIVEALD